MPSSNWIELGLSEEEAEDVRAVATIYRTIHIPDIDNIFRIANKIEFLRQRCYGNGIQGAFGDILVQFKFVAHDGGPMNKAIRSAYNALRENEAAVRKWWASVPAKEKRTWTSGEAVCHHWKASLKPPPDPNKPRELSPIAKERVAVAALEEENEKLRTRLKTADGGNLFDIERDSAETIGVTIASAWASSPARIKKLIDTLTEKLPEIERLYRSARPRGRGRGK